MVHVIKVFLKEENSESEEIRRVAVSSDVVSKYELLYEKIKELFPRLKNKAFVLSWKDPEGDLILFSSDDELAQALANAEEGFCKIYVNLLCDKQNVIENNDVPLHDELHPRAICDVCDTNIRGYRYKCLQCKDYDLCSSCNAANKHPDHDMLKLVKPTYVPRDWVFLGARKIWRSMFGHVHGGFHEGLDRHFNYDFKKDKHRDCKKEKHGDSKKDSKKEKHRASGAEKWQDAFSHIWKGGFLPADKVFQDSIGNFLKMAGVEVKIEKCPFNKDYSGDGETSDEACSENAQEPEKEISDEKPFNDKTKEIPKTGDEKEVIEETETQSEENEIKLDDKCSAESNHEDSILPSSEQLEAIPSNSAVRGLFTVEDKIEKEEIHSPTVGNEMETSNYADGWTLLNNDYACKKASLSSPVTSTSKEDNTNCDEKKEKVIDQEPPKDPKIASALLKMYAMGFTNEGGWLEKLLITKDGNINDALDALYPNTQRH